MSDAERLDAEDPLASFRELFAIEDEGTIYLDGNSLGRPPAATRERMTELVDRWGSDLVRGWDDWIELPERVGDLLATGVLGARPGEAIVCDSTTINLYKLASALIADRPGAILADAGDFPTNRYVLAGLARAQGRRLVLARDGIPAALGDDDLALVSLSHVDYRTGALADTEAIEAASPAPVLWDLSHSAGVVVPEGISYAVGCTYKYLNGGPGAPGFLHVRADRLAELENPIQGWFSQEAQFAMGPDYEPAAGIRRFLTGTPGIPALVAVEEGVRIVAEAGVERVRAKAMALTALRRRAARRVARSARVRARRPARRRRHAALTSACATRTPGRSAAR